MLPTLNGTLHIAALLIGIAWELYSTCNPIYDRVMRLEPIDTEYNLAREVLAHITSYRQLQRAIPHAGSKKLYKTHHTITLKALPICHGDL